MRKSGHTRLRLHAVLASCCLAAATVPAPALPLVRPHAAPTAFLAEGERSLAPLAHVKFCMDHADECRSGAGADVVEGDGLRLLDRVNRAVNRGIRPRTEQAVIGRWSVGPATGDCNDYAVTKRHALIALGVPAPALRLAVVETAGGEGHLVLVARTRAGDHVLDNLSSRVRPWHDTGHRFLKVQMARDARSWAAVANP
jgi:predicted transglutaminase-like cysteine proteinase